MDFLLPSFPCRQVIHTVASRISSAIEVPYPAFVWHTPFAVHLAQQNHRYALRTFSDSRLIEIEYQSLVCTPSKGDLSGGVYHNRSHMTTKNLFCPLGKRGFLDGTHGRIRTSGLPLRRRPLYPAELRGRMDSKHSIAEKSDFVNKKSAERVRRSADVHFGKEERRGKEIRD